MCSGIQSGIYPKNSARLSSGIRALLLPVFLAEIPQEVHAEIHSEIC